MWNKNVIKIWGAKVTRIFELTTLCVRFGEHRNRYRKWPAAVVNAIKPSRIVSARSANANETVSGSLTEPPKHPAKLGSSNAFGDVRVTMVGTPERFDDPSGTGRSGWGFADDDFHLRAGRAQAFIDDVVESFEGCGLFASYGTHPVRRSRRCPRRNHGPQPRPTREARRKVGSRSSGTKGGSG